MTVSSQIKWGLVLDSEPNQFMRVWARFFWNQSKTPFMSNYTPDESESTAVSNTQLLS